ncbi:hypothetical protein BDZ91DRAFT_768258 [Kalaharituber pfeilii]|nr:hypothetical protein BDZ91DRAFT_768258 [Kalaharituber pfeilii]
MSVSNESAEPTTRVLTVLISHQFIQPDIPNTLILARKTNNQTNVAFAVYQMNDSSLLSHSNTFIWEENFRVFFISTNNDTPGALVRSVPFKTRFTPIACESGVPNPDSAQFVSLVYTTTNAVGIAIGKSTQYDENSRLLLEVADCDQDKWSNGGRKSFAVLKAPQLRQVGCQQLTGKGNYYSRIHGPYSRQRERSTGG